MIRIAVVIGHTWRSPGAVGLAMPPEHVFNTRVMLEVVKQVNVDVFYNDTYRHGYRQMVLQTAKKTRDYDFVFELHYNSYDDRDINGAEVLIYPGNVDAKAIAHEFLRLMRTLLGIRTRRIVEVGAKSRGYLFLALNKPTAIVLEPGFGSSWLDSDKLSIDGYAQILITLFKSIKNGKLLFR